MNGLKQKLAVLVLALLFVAVPAGVVHACSANLQSCSTTYGVGETFFGSGGNLNWCGTAYCSKVAVGELTVGSTAGGIYQAKAGFNTNREEYLQFVVNTSTVDLGVLSTTGPHVGTAQFSVKTYLAHGYQVVTSSPPPVMGTHTMAAPTTPTASAPGTEQFGMNVVANTCPAGAPSSGSGSCSGTLGAAPAQVPDSTFSYGQAAGAAQNTVTNGAYDQANKFDYNNGDSIAYSSKSSGETDFTISYLMNISNVTPAGTYTMTQVLIATSTF